MEVDFVICHDRRPQVAIEVKLKDFIPSPNFKILENAGIQVPKYQLVYEDNIHKESPSGVVLCSADTFLSQLV